MADALCWLACQGVGPPPLRRPPVVPDTLAYLLQKRQEEREAKERW